MVNFYIPFKYNKQPIKDSTHYLWPLNFNKYSLGRKMFNKCGGLVERSRTAAAQQLTDPLSCMCFPQGKGQVNSISHPSLSVCEKTTSTELISEEQPSALLDDVWEQV